jgi:hypothetical protein
MWAAKSTLSSLIFGKIGDPESTLYQGSVDSYDWRPNTHQLAIAKLATNGSE